MHSKPLEIFSESILLLTLALWNCLLEFRGMLSIFHLEKCFDNHSTFNKCMSFIEMQRKI